MSAKQRAQGVWLLGCAASLLLLLSIWVTTSREKQYETLIIVTMSPKPPGASTNHLDTNGFHEQNLESTTSFPPKPSKTPPPDESVFTKMLEEEGNEEDDDEGKGDTLKNPTPSQQQQQQQTLS